MIARLLALGFATMFAVFLGIGTAYAHAVPTASVPGNDARIDTGPPRASVTFSEALQESFASLTVVGPDGNLWSKGEPSVEGATVSVDLGELGPVGEYQIAFRVTSADGHPVSGTRSFTLTTAGSGTPGAKADANSSGDGGIPLWPFIISAVVLFGGGLAYALRGPKRTAG